MYFNNQYERALRAQGLKSWVCQRNVGALQNRAAGNLHNKKVSFLSHTENKHTLAGSAIKIDQTEILSSRQLTKARAPLGTGFQSIGPTTSFRNLSQSQKRCILKFINLCMRHGKKNKSYNIFSNTLQRLSLLEGPLALMFCLKAIENVKPTLEVKKVRISGTTQLVPSILSSSRQTSLAIRWIVEAAKGRRNSKKGAQQLDQCILAELVEAAQNTGVVKKRRDDLHKLAESNRGFAHYRWW